MSNTKKIQPITVWSINGQVQVNCLALINFFDYHFDNLDGKVSYVLIETNDELGATEHFTGNVEIPPHIMQQWGTDDSIIWDYVIEKLNLVVIDIPEILVEPEEPSTPL
jgi:hypothetical protein